MDGLIASFAEIFSPEHAVANFAALFQVILIDLALAGDNAVAVGLAAAALPPLQQRRAIFWGIVMALVLRIAFASVTIHLLNIPGLLLAGGLLLFWVAWRMWSDLKAHQPIQVGNPVAAEHAAEDIVTGGKAPKTFGSALLTIVIADVSMSARQRARGGGGVAPQRSNHVVWAHPLGGDDGACSVGDRARD